MGDIDKRGSRYRARWRDPDGRQRSKSFRTEDEAKRWLTKVGHDVLTGAYVDPATGRETFKAVAERWRKVKRHAPGTQEQIASHFERHVYPAIGHRAMASFRPSDVQELVTTLEEKLAPSTVAVVYAYVSNVFKFAVRDRIIAATPCVEIEVGERRSPIVQLLTSAQVAAITEGMPKHFAALAITGAGSGLRPGELLGLTVDRVDFLRHTITVDRQLFSPSSGAPFLRPPKTLASERTVPVPSLVTDALAAHLARWPAIIEPIEWMDRGRRRSTVDAALVFRSRTKHVVRRSTWNGTFRRVADGCGTDWATPHDLRHYYASMLIREGLDIKTVAARLGHKSIVTTGDLYGHLWPDNEDRTRDAVAAELGAALGLA